ncbi:MAG: SpoIIE family protein phosphatase, partial [Myxococcota bacterium]
MASLIFLAGPNAGRRYKLVSGDYILGRRSDCQIFVPDMRVSRQHARIHRENAQWTVEDLGSNNGTYVNGERIQNAKLSHDDEITIANNRIRVEMPASGKRKLDSSVTIVDTGNSEVYLSRTKSDSGLLSVVKDSDGSRLTDTRPSGTLRLMERKLQAVQTLLEIAANVADPDKLVESVVAQLLEVFPQAHSVGVLVQDERSGELKVQCRKTRQKNLFGGDLKVPGTIINHVVNHHSGVLLSMANSSRASSDAEASAPEFRGSDPAKGPMREPNGSRMGAPLQARNMHYGVIYVEGRKEESFRQEDLDLLTSIAFQTGLAIHAARMQNHVRQRQRLERDLRVARQIQRSLMRDPPHVIGMDFAIHYEPAYQIGGDFYDFIWHDKDHLAIVAGDVAGKAISAALYMARLTSEIRGRAGIARTPERLLKRVNEEMVKLGDDGMFATLVYAVYQLSTRSLIFTNAGHCVPLLRRGEHVFPLHADRAHIAPIGVLPDLEVGEAKVQLFSGDLLVLTSDGILEARDPAGNEYGLKRLSRRIRTARGGPDDVVKAILQDVDSHVASGTQADDMTIVAMGVADRRARRRSTTVPGMTSALGPDGPPGDEPAAGVRAPSRPQSTPTPTRSPSGATPTRSPSGATPTRSPSGATPNRTLSG